MRPLAHLISVILLLPSLALACGFVILGHVLRAKSLFDLLTRLLMDATWTLMLVFLALIIVVLGLLLLGLSDRLRWIAGLCVAILAIASMSVLIVLTGAPDSLQRWEFFVPGLVSFGIAAWLAASRITRVD